jgi:predicted nucleic acid-binding protein
MQTYSPYFKTLYDQPEPIGRLGRGTHYSVLRCLGLSGFHDFAIIWDEDHDKRVIAVQQVEDGTVVADHVLDQTDGLLEHRLAQIVIETGKALAIDRIVLFKAAEVEPVAGEFQRQSSRAVILQHTAGLRHKDIRLLQIAGLRASGAVPTPKEQTKVS